MQETLHIHIFIIHDFRYLQKLLQTTLSQFIVHVFTALPLGESLKKVIKLSMASRRRIVQKLPVLPLWYLTPSTLKGINSGSNTLWDRSVTGFSFCRPGWWAGACWWQMREVPRGARKHPTPLKVEAGNWHLAASAHTLPARAVTWPSSVSARPQSTLSWEWGGSDCSMKNNRIYQNFTLIDLKVGDFPELSRWAQYKHKSPYKKVKGREEM